MIQVIHETQEKYHFDLSGFQILNNHFHFVIKTLPGGETISKIMQRIKSVFARRYNKIHGRTGPVWNERFGSKIIEAARDAASYLLNLLWYLAYNVLGDGNTGDPRMDPYGSINCYLDEQYRPRLTIRLHEAFFTLGKTFRERAAAFLLFEKRYLSLEKDDEG